MASLESRAVWQTMMERKKTQDRADMTIEQQREQLDEMTQIAPLASDVHVDTTTLSGVFGEWVSTPGCRTDQVFLYLHGGAYTRGSCTSHRGLASHLSRACGIRVLVIEYRLAPEHPYPSAVEDAVAVYRALVDSGFNPKNIVIGGDSAGGGLAMAALLSLRDAHDPLPTTAILLSPWTDLAGTGESIKSKADLDPWLTPESLLPLAKLYLGDLDLRHPLASPLYADLRNLPPIFVQVGDYEILLDDSRELVNRLKEANVQVTFKIWEGMWHVFQIWADAVPESRQAIQEIGEYVRAMLS